MSLIERIFRMIFPKPQMYLGGGGGGDVPESTTQTQITIPPYIQPYIESLLGKTQALTSGAQFEPFDPSKRFAPSDPLQQQSYDVATGMTTAPQLGQATDAANSAIDQGQQASQFATPLMNTALGMGNLALGAQGQFNNTVTDPSQVQSFMSPYMQNVVDVQKNEAVRDYQKQLQDVNAAATKAGAFGGSRNAILQAEGMRNLNTNLGNIQAQGQQQAFDDAMKQIQFGSNLGMQGLQTGLQGVGQGINAAGLGLQGANTALQGANTLGQLGQTQFGQQQSLVDLLNTLGTQRQQQAQNTADFNYQQFIDELNFPYQQLSFLSDMTRGLPLSNTTVYQNQAGPNSTSQLLGSGLMAAGLLNRARGGRIKRFAEGGQVSADAFDEMSMDDVASAVRLLDDRQLSQYASMVKDATTLAVIQNEVKRRGKLRAAPTPEPMGTIAQGVAGEAAQQAQATSGLGAVPQAGLRAPAQIEQQVPPRASGIAAFESGGKVKPEPWFPFGSRPPARAAQPIPIQVPRAIMPEGRTDPPRVPFSTQDVQPLTAMEVMKQAQDRRDAIVASQVDPTGLSNAAMRSSLGQDQTGMPMQAAFGYTAPTNADFETRVVDPSISPPPALPGGPNANTSAAVTPAAAPAAGGAPRAPAGPGGIAGLIAAAGEKPSPQAAPDITQSYDEYMDRINSQARDNTDFDEYTKAMNAGLDDSTAKAAAATHRSQMDALIAAGAAMMQGRTVGEGLALGAAAGVKGLQKADDQQTELEQGLAKARVEQARYEASLRAGNRDAAQKALGDWTRHTDLNVELAQKRDLTLAQIGAQIQMNNADNATRMAVSQNSASAYKALAKAQTADMAKMNNAIKLIDDSIPGKAYAKLTSDPASSAIKTKEQFDQLKRDLFSVVQRVSDNYGIPLKAMPEFYQQLGGGGVQVQQGAGATGGVPQMLSRGQ